MMDNKVKTAADQLQLQTEEQRREFQQRLEESERRRQKFEEMNEQKRLENKRAAEEKAEHIARTQRVMDQKELEKKKRILEQERRAQERLEQKRIEEEGERAEKQHMLDLDAKKKKDAYDAMVKREEEKVARILREREEKEKVLERVRMKEAEENLLKIEVARQKQEENEYTQNRRQRMEEYRRQKILERIEQDNLRAKAVEDEKSKILQQREKFRMDGLMQKHQILQTFEKIKVTKKFDKMNAELSKFGGDASIAQSNQFDRSVSTGNRAHSAGHTRSESGHQQQHAPRDTALRPKRPFSADTRRSAPPKDSEVRQSHTARDSGSGTQAFVDKNQPEEDPFPDLGGGDGGESPQSRRRQVVQKQVEGPPPEAAAGNKPGKLRAQTSKSKGKSVAAQGKNDFGKKRRRWTCSVGNRTRHSSRFLRKSRRRKRNEKRKCVKYGIRANANG